MSVPFLNFVLAQGCSIYQGLRVHVLLRLNDLSLDRSQRYPRMASVRSVRSFIALTIGLTSIRLAYQYNSVKAFNYNCFIVKMAIVVLKDSVNSHE